MADANLDDFFAKRDKKKKAGKKFDTTEDLTKILGKRAEERKKLEEGKSQYVLEEGDHKPPAANEDDEWLEVQEPEIDLTGLKVSELILPDDDEEEVHSTKEGQEGGGVNEGVWKKKKQAAEEPSSEPLKEEVVVEETTKSGEGDESSTNTSTPTSATTPTPTPTEPESKPVPAPTAEPSEPQPKKYIPPSLRAKMQQQGPGGSEPSQKATPAPAQPAEHIPAGSAAYVPPWKRSGGSGSAGTPGAKSGKPKHLPDITNEEYFPSLGGS